jgi:hypothetical protein
MDKRWIVIPSLLVLTVIGAVATTPALQHFWQKLGLRPEVVVDRAMRVKVIDTLVAQLNDHYVFPDKAKEIAAVLHQRQQEGKYDGIRNGSRLARQLTADLHGVAKDLHMKVRFAPDVILPDGADGPPPASQAEWEQRNNFVMRLVQRHMATRRVVRVGNLGANIGYLKISRFPAAFLMAEKFAAAMDELADTDGLILDLRYNGGGDPQSVALLISYFVDQRTRLNDIWDRETGVTTQQWTEDKLNGKRYGGKKPVLILVGPDTMSAGEDFAYTMQALKRATVVGERTWGGAHPTSLHRIGEHFFAMIPGQRAISPITHTNWEGVGVIPDIAATPDSALAVAKPLLQRRLQGAAPLSAKPISATEFGSGTASAD